MRNRVFNVKIILLITLLIFINSLAGCMIVKDNDKNESYNKCLEILHCFDEKDAEALKRLFCQRIQDDSNIDKEIEEAYTLYNGKSKSFKFNFCGGISGSWRNGKAIDEHISPNIEKIKTDSDDVYLICYHEYLTYVKDETCVGITYIRIFNEKTDEMIQIGEHVY